MKTAKQFLIDAKWFNDENDAIWITPNQIIEAMGFYAQQEAIGFYNYCNNLDVSNLFKYKLQKEPMELKTLPELYQQYLNNKQK